MNPKNIHKLSTDGTLFVLESWTSAPCRDLIERTPKLAPWLDDLTADHQALLTHQPAHPSPASAEGTIKDRRASAAIRALNLSLLLGAELARSQGHADDSPEVSLWDTAHQATFPDGLGFLRLSWAEQVSATDRLIERTRSAPTQAIAPLFNAHNHDLAHLIATATSTNDALRSHAKDRITDAAPLNSPPMTESATRRQAHNRIRDFVRVIHQAFPPSSQRDLLLNPLLHQLKP
jgi:hypothetical protein